MLTLFCLIINTDPWGFAVLLFSAFLHKVFTVIAMLRCGITLHLLKVMRFQHLLDFRHCCGFATFPLLLYNSMWASNASLYTPVGLICSICVH